MFHSATAMHRVDKKNTSKYKKKYIKKTLVQRHQQQQYKKKLNSIQVQFSLYY